MQNVSWTNERTYRQTETAQTFDELRSFWLGKKQKADNRIEKRDKQKIAIAAALSLDVFGSLFPLRSGF